MPKKWIEFPPSVQFYDPFTNELVKDEEGKQDEMDFGEFLKALMSNPLWNEGYARAQAQDAIMRSFYAASERQASGMWVTEEDHKFLESAAREPRTLHIGPMGPQVLAGFGRHPGMARQFLPFQSAIILATTMELEKASEKVG